MQDKAAIPFVGGVARIFNRSKIADCEEWQRAFRDRCKDHRFYELIEETLANDFEYHYIVVEDAAGGVRAVQPVFFVRQNLIEGVPGKIRTIVDLIRKTFPRFLTMRVLMVGCAAGEGQLGTLDSNDNAWMAEALGGVVANYAKQSKASLVVWKDFPANYRPPLVSLIKNGYARVPSMPMTRLRLSHKNFDDYLGALGYITRKSLRRKFRKIERQAKIEMAVVTDIGPYVDEIYPLYLQVHERSPMKFEVLTREFFSSIGPTMPERARFFLWRIKGKLVAFSLCLICGDTLHDECLGLDYDVALELHLYFYTLRDVLSWAMAQGLGYYSSGPLNYDPKLHLGHELLPLDLYVLHTRRWLNPIFHVAVKYLEPTRHDPVLRKFSNADQLWSKV
jgi:Acetyltransferase (GNAT) domain